MIFHLALECVSKEMWHVMFLWHTEQQTQVCYMTEVHSSASKASSSPTQPVHPYNLLLYCCTVYTCIQGQHDAALSAHLSCLIHLLPQCVLSPAHKQLTQSLSHIDSSSFNNSPLLFTFICVVTCTHTRVYFYPCHSQVWLEIKSTRLFISELWKHSRWCCSCC